MRDPLVWRCGDGPMADWLERVAELVVGPQPDGYRVWGDLRWPDQVYGRVVASGLTPAQLAEVFTAEGFDGLYADTHGGATLDAPTVHIAPLTWEDRGPSGQGVRILHAEPAGPVGGRVRIAAPLHTPDELTAWMRQLSPVLPDPAPRVDWPASAGTTPLAGTFLHRRDTLLLCLDTLESRQRPGNASNRLRLHIPTDGATWPASPAGRTALPADRSVTSVQELADWLGELGVHWSGGPLPRVGMWAGASPLPRGTLASAQESADGLGVLRFARPGRPGLSARGPAAGIADWAVPLLEPAVHEDVPAQLRRFLARWLRKVEQAAFAGPAEWTVSGFPGPFSSAQLAQWLNAHCGDGRIAVDRLADGAVVLNGAVTPGGETAVTGRPSRT
ncbi:hypothetical protein KNE206_62740 [Kitasatospora sp. NE20-6]